MTIGILGIEAVPAFVSSVPDTQAAVTEKIFINPREKAIAIVPQWDNPVIENGQFVRFPIKVNVQSDMGIWNLDGSFEKSPEAPRVWEEPDICKPELLAKYPNLAGYISGILGIIHSEMEDSGVI